MILLTDQFDEELKLIKKAMQTADCDMSVVRAWLKLYEKVKKQTTATKDSYIQARANLDRWLWKKRGRAAGAKKKLLRSPVNSGRWMEVMNMNFLSAVKIRNTI